jgi:hypothetical protein
MGFPVLDGGRVLSRDLMFPLCFAYVQLDSAPRHRVASMVFSGSSRFFSSVISCSQPVVRPKFGEKVRGKKFFSAGRKNSWTENLPTLVIFAQTILKYAIIIEVIIRKNSDKKNFQKCLDHI